MSFDAFLREHRRLSVLRTLADAPSYRSNDSLLTQAVSRFGLDSTRDQVRQELTWLAEQGLVTVEDLAGIMIATITERGSDVAAGRVAVPGVQKPGPKKA